MQRILIGIITAIVVTVAKPIRFDAYIRLLTFQMIRRASGVLRTSVMGFIRRHIILTIVHSVAYLRYETLSQVKYDFKFKVFKTLNVPETLECTCSLRT